jgi:hypothetical protein
VRQLENLALRHQIGVLQRFHEKTTKIDSVGLPDSTQKLCRFRTVFCGVGHGKGSHRTSEEFIQFLNQAMDEEWD